MPVGCQDIYITLFWCSVLDLFPSSSLQTVEVFFTSTSLVHFFTVGLTVFPYSGRIYSQIMATLPFFIVFFAMDFFLAQFWL